MTKNLLGRWVNKLGNPGTSSRLKRLRDNEDGVFVVLSLFILIIIFIAIGFAVDVARHEAMRVRLSSTLDRAVLAAADLTNGRDPQATVEDYFVKSNFLASDVRVVVSNYDSGRSVQAIANKAVNTWFMRLVGVDSINAVAAGTAAQGVSNVEVSLVLDLSMSMTDAPQGGSKAKFEYLKDAANVFVDSVLTGGQNTIFVSLIPYGSQVRLGDGVVSNMNATRADVGTNNYNTDCIDFKDSDFTRLGGFDTGVSAQFSRTIIFDTGNTSRTQTTQPATPTGQNTNQYRNNCPTADLMRVAPYKTDAQQLKNIISTFYSNYSNGPYNYTSVDIGAKWGLAFLDPSMREEIQAMANDNARMSGNYDVPNAAIGHPYDYTFKDPTVAIEDQTMKVMVLMTDGLNTNDWQTREFYKQTARPSFIWASADWTKMAFNVIERTTITNMEDGDGSRSEAWFNAYCSSNCGRNSDWQGTNRWTSNPAWNNLQRKTWPEVFARFRVAFVADQVARMLATRNGNTNPDNNTLESYFLKLYGRWTGGSTVVSDATTILGFHSSESERWDKLPYGFYELYYLNDSINSAVNPKNKDQRLQSICSLAKSTGLGADGLPDGSPRHNIIVYTVGYDLSSPSNANALTQLQNCATPGKFFAVTGASGLTDAFKQIANEIGKLRLTQ